MFRVSWMGVSCIVTLAVAKCGSMMWNAEPGVDHWHATLHSHSGCAARRVSCVYR